MVKIFAHRGYCINNVAENSLQSLDEAFESNFHGIELDLHFIENQIVVHHDKVTRDNMENFSKFEEFLKYKDQILYWLDFKNLHNLSDEELGRALKLTLLSIEDSKCDLGQFYFAPYVTNFAIAKKIYRTIRQIFPSNVKIMAVCDKLEPKDYQSFYENLLQENICRLSIRHNLINQDLIDVFSGIEIFAWTVNDIGDACKLTKDLKVTNFTTDSITLKILFDQ